MSKTAKEIALEACPSGVQSKVAEVAAQSSIPDDDPLWLVFLANAEARLIPVLLDKLAAMEEAMALLTEALLENDATLQTVQQQVSQAITEGREQGEEGKQSQIITIKRWLGTSIAGIFILVIAAAIEGFAALQQPDQSIYPRTQSLETTEAIQTSDREPSSTASVLPLSDLKDRFSRVNQERLEACIADGNSKCTLLIEESEPNLDQFDLDLSSDDDETDPEIKLEAEEFID